MCNFLSGIAFGPKLENKFGRFYADPKKTDSHTDMERDMKLSDRHDDPEWAKWEYTPGNNFLDFSTYNFRLDEKRKPEWWNEELEPAAIEFAKKQLEEVVLRTGRHEIKEGRIWLAGDAYAVLRESSSAELWGSSSAELWGSSSAELWGSSTGIQHSDRVVLTLHDLGAVVDRSGGAPVLKVAQSANPSEPG